MCVYIYTHTHTYVYTYIHTHTLQALPTAWNSTVRTHTHTYINAHINTNHRPYQRLEILPRTHWQMLATMILKFFKVHIVKSHLATQCTADPIWHFRMLFQSSKLRARTSLLPRFSEKRRSSFRLWCLKELSKLSRQVGLVVLLYIVLYIKK